VPWSLAVNAMLCVCVCVRVRVRVVCVSWTGARGSISVDRILFLHISRLSEREGEGGREREKTEERERAVVN
jgi:hypothetical protein